MFESALILTGEDGVHRADSETSQKTPPGMGLDNTKRCSTFDGAHAFSEANVSFDGSKSETDVTVSVEGAVLCQDIQSAVREFLAKKMLTTSLILTARAN